MKTTEQTSANDSPTPAVEQAEIGYINQPTVPMRASGIKDWSKLDTELWKLVSAWPNDSVPDRNWFYYWARKIHKSISGVATVTVSESAVIEVLKNVVPRFPLLNTFEDWSDLRSAARNVGELIAGLDEPTRLALACIYWRWGQVAAAVERGRMERRWDKERADSLQSKCVFQLRPEHKQAIDGFRRSFRVELPNGQPATDAQVAGHFFDSAFLIPDQIYEAARRLIRYRNAEGLKPNDAMRAMCLVAASIGASSETVTPAAKLPASQPTEATLDEANKLCDPALSEFTLDLGAGGRLQLADRLERWAEQLRASAALLQQSQRGAA